MLYMPTTASCQIAKTVNMFNGTRAPRKKQTSSPLVSIEISGKFAAFSPSSSNTLFLVICFKLAPHRPVWTAATHPLDFYFAHMAICCSHLIVGICLLVSFAFSAGDKDKRQSPIRVSFNRYFVRYNFFTSGPNTSNYLVYWITKCFQVQIQIKP